MRAARFFAPRGFGPDTPSREISLPMSMHGRAARRTSGCQKILERIGVYFLGPVTFTAREEVDQYAISVVIVAG